jgi:hypothetical protein
MAWSRYRRCLKRKFSLKQWRWSFEEHVGDRGWCYKLPNPFTVEKRKDIALHCTKGLHETPGSGNSCPI